MGWSCSAAASDTMRRWDEACRQSTGSSNQWREADGAEFFVEISRREHQDGAITGTVFKMLPNSRCRRVGTVRIEGDGRVARAPKFLKAASAA